MSDCIRTHAKRVLAIIENELSPTGNGCYPVFWRDSKRDRFGHPLSIVPTLHRLAENVHALVPELAVCRTSWRAFFGDSW